MSHRASIPDGQRCINCHVRAKCGAIKHATSCPEWTRPKGCEAA